MRQPILLPVPPVKRKQPFVARHGNTYRAQICLKSGEFIQFRIKAETHALAMFRAGRLYLKREPISLTIWLIEGIEPPPTVEYRDSGRQQAQRHYVQQMSRLFRRIFLNEKE